MLVMKFGGTSVGSPERLARVLEIVRRARAEGPVLVVVSAMQHTTDRLIEAADLAAGGDLPGAERVVDGILDLTVSNGLVVLTQIGAGGAAARAELMPRVREVLAPLRLLLSGVALLRERTPQTLDLVLSFGERLSASVVALLLDAAGVPALFVDSRGFVVTDATFGNALVDLASSKARLDEVRAGWGDRLPVVTGFLGATPDGRSTTLGRNGSDYTATLLARWLGAAEVVVWTDVSGVMTADPALVDDAYPLSHLSYMEALELVDFGASMFHSRTMIPLIESGIPMRIRNTMHPNDAGTLIDARGGDDERAATSVTSLENLALLGVQVRRVAKRAVIASRVFAALEAAGIGVWMANQSAHGQAVAVAVPVARVEAARAALHEALATELARGEAEPVTVRAPVTLLTLVAEAMGRTVDVAGRFFHALGSVGIPIRAIAQGASARSISCVVDADDTRVAVRTVHAAFNFAHQQVSLLVLGRGTVGGALLGQIREQREVLAREHDVDLKVVGIAGRRKAVFDERGIDLAAWSERVAAENGAGPAPAEGLEPDLEDLLDRLKRLPVPVLVDCTAADGMERLYHAAFERGIHVVAANKKPLTVSWAAREALMDAARRHHRAYRYETTVGASLPVIETLKNLVRTGDHVRLVEGSFSGTLGYVANELMGGGRLSEVVRRARDLGYTEPNPLEDLSGQDVARKALILSRELGLAIDAADVRVTPMFDLGLPLDAPLEQLFAALEARDAEVAATVADRKAAGEVLRYLARIERGATSSDPACVSVGPVWVPADHPSTRLRGTEAFVAFTTGRYNAYPLVVQGAGAGGQVTAAGVLADVLATSNALVGR